MGKGTDKLYITHSEWASEDAYSASAGSGVRQNSAGRSFRRLPFNFCALSLQPFSHPVCTGDGTIFDLTHILPWLAKHGTNPVDGQSLKSKELIKLNFVRNEEGGYVDPVTYKPFTDNTHIVALKNTGNVFAYETVERLNIKAKMWRDLVSDEEFSRKDMMTLQDPQNLEARDLSSFKFLKDGTSSLTEEQKRERNDPASKVNGAALGNASRIIKAKQAVATARAQREADDLKGKMQAHSLATANKGSTTSKNFQSSMPTPYNAAKHTDGRAAASLTSTGLTPHTSNERALLTEEEYMLKPKRVKNKGYLRLTTSLGELRIELLPEWAPKAVWNFVTLANSGFYNGVAFHRNIRSFMIQGGDPTGTGKGGSSCWGRNFDDEFEGPNTHDTRGIVSMANKGKNTNSSQFFITYRAVKHLDRKHTIFGRVVEGMEVLDRMERAEVSEKDKRPMEDIAIREAVVLIDPFEEWRSARQRKEDDEREQDEVKRSGGTEDDKVTWTGRKVERNGRVSSSTAQGGVGKYLKRAVGDVDLDTGQDDEVVGEWTEEEAPYEPPKKKAKGGFGSFDNW